MRHKTFDNNALMSEIEATITGGEKVQLTINSGSMRPFLIVGDVVELGEVSSAELRRGDVVLFRYNNQQILHRIRHIRGNKLIIRGDGNYHKTELATRGDVAARVTAIIKHGKKIKTNSCFWHYLTTTSLLHKFIRNTWWSAKKVMKRFCRIK